MKPVYQTNNSIIDGNCLVACIASIFENKIEDYPDLPLDAGWLDKINEYLIEKEDCYICLVGVNNYTKHLVKGYHLILVDIVGQEKGHCLVGKDAEIVFNPSKHGVGEFENSEFGLFVNVLDPIK